MKIGVVRERKNHEYRVGLTPAAVKAFAQAGHGVLVQAGAGLGSSFADEEYAGAGARLAPDAQSVWAEADMIVKVKEPIEPEYPLMRENQIVYTYLHLAADRPLTEQLLARRVKAVAYETITGPGNSLPCLTPMSQIAGRLSVQEGAKYLERPFGGRGVLLSGVPGTEKAQVVIVGGGVVGENAAKIALGFGARVAVLDVNLARLIYLDDVFGGAIETLYSDEHNLVECLKRADLTIGAVLIPGKAAPKLIRREHLARMKPASVIVDVAVDQGGCAETTHATTHQDPIYFVDGILHYCVANMPGAVPRTSTMALVNATLPYGLAIANLGLERALRADANLLPGLNAYAGCVTCPGVAEAFGMECASAAELL